MKALDPGEAHVEPQDEVGLAAGLVQLEALGLGARHAVQQPALAVHLRLLHLARHDPDDEVVGHQLRPTHMGAQTGTQFAAKTAAQRCTTRQDD